MAREKVKLHEDINVAMKEGDHTRLNELLASAEQGSARKEAQAYALDTALFYAGE